VNKSPTKSDKGKPKLDLQKLLVKPNKKDDNKSPTKSDRSKPKLDNKRVSESIKSKTESESESSESEEDGEKSPTVSELKR
jgi:hypothetical protein